MRRYVSYGVVGVVIAAGLVVFAVVVTSGAGSPHGPLAITKHTRSMTVTLKLTPGTAGPNTFTVLLRNRGKPVSSANVTVLETMLDMSMGTQVVLLAQKAPGTYSGSGVAGMGGHWNFLVQIKLPSGAAPISDNFRATVTP